ncbi:Quinonprotein alcohol dehydrogenase-like-superfamily [Artemisia annua]|uniref:Quinonprotein alcohol dehydrogenase-like-superfamily n=1 Tax=Artemisia annua TaxID=35608 RepID=A0A2U1P9V6_ARTAN|nr:Quinonprotein alcohol dehydrogenase-like-superfamily [Artemisia annua]
MCNDCAFSCEVRDIDASGHPEAVHLVLFGGMVNALDGENTEGALFTVPSTFNVADTGSRTISSTKDDAEADEMIICLEDRLKAEGILSSDKDLM